MDHEGESRNDDEKGELLSAILSCRKAIQQNQALLAKLVNEYRTGYPRDPLPLWADRYLIFRDVPIAVPSDFLDGGSKIQQLLLETRTVFWRRILGSKRPQQAFIRWVRHIAEISTGRCQCEKFSRIVLHQK